MDGENVEQLNAIAASWMLGSRCKNEEWKVNFLRGVISYVDDLNKSETTNSDGGGGDDCNYFF